MIPPRVILTGVDFSDPSRTALAFAARLARHTGAALHVLHVEDPLLAEAARHSGIDLAKDTEEELGRFLATASPAAQASPMRHVATGPAADRILEVAEQQKADLVVVGSHGMSGVARVVFGSVTEAILHRAGMSVLVTPSEWSHARSDAVDLSGTGPVVAGMALSPPSLAAGGAACRLAAALGTTVEMVHIVPALTVLARWRKQADTALHDRVAAARTALDAVMHTVACQVPVVPRVANGAVAEGLAEVASPSGTRRPILVLGRLAPDQGVPGGIAYRALMLAQVPVLMYLD